MDDFPATQVLECTQVLDATQILGGDDGEAGGPVVVGRLEVGTEKYQVVVGDNRIGRDPRCEVFISNPSLSRTHAVIEADREGCTLHDVRSSNGTKKGGVRLKANVRYNLESGEQLVFGDVTAVFLAGVEPGTAGDSDNDSNVSDSLFDMEDNVDGDDENKPPNFVPDTPVAAKVPMKPLSRPSLGDLSFVPESQSSPLPTSILKQQALFKVPDSPSTDLDDSSFLCPSQQPVQARERPSRLVAGSFRPGQDRTSTQLMAPIEQLETSVSSDKSGGVTATVVPDSDDEDDMFAAGTQAVNDTDDEAIGPTQAVNETEEEPLATQAVDETVEDTIVEENELFDAETQNVDAGSEKVNEILESETQALVPKLPPGEGLFKRVNTEDLNNLFNKSKPETVQSGPLVSACESDVLGADTQALGLKSDKTQASDLLGADTQAPNHLEADTQATDLLGADTQATDLLAADTQAPDLMGADTQAPDLLAADTQAPGLLGADTQAPDLLEADTQAPEILEADTQAPDLLGADTQDVNIADLASDKPVRPKLSDSEIMCASTQALVASLSDSDLTGDPRPGAGSKLSDSYIMCASTQTLVARLSDSDLLAANTQADMSDSLVLGSATQAVPTAGVQVVNSMDLLEDPSSCDTSAEDLLMLATQPVFKLPCLPMGKSRSSTSVPETNSALEADTEPIVTDDALFEAETAPLEEPSLLRTEPEESDPKLDADTEPLAVEDAETVLVEEATVGKTEAEIVAMDEDETQCLESFTDIKDNLEAEDEKEEPEAPLEIPPTSNVMIDTEDAASDVSEDLLANEDDLELRLDDTRNESAEADHAETSRLSNTTLTSVSMVEASQPPVQPMAKGFSVNNRTDVNSMTMDQTSVVESDIVSANDDTDAMSDASDNLLEDQEDLPTEEALDQPVDIPKPATPAPVAALLQAENIDSPVFKKRPLTPVEIAIRNNTGANDSKELCLLLDSSVEESPVFRKKNSSVCAAAQNSSGLIKSLIEEDEDEDLNVTAGSAKAVSPEPSKTLVDQVPESDVNKIGASVTKGNSSISVRRRSSTPEDAVNITKEVAPSEMLTEIIAEVVSPAKSSEADSGPLLPETQALRVEEEEVSDDELDDLEEAQRNEVGQAEPESNEGKVDEEEIEGNEAVEIENKMMEKEETPLGKGKRVRKLTPKAEELLDQKTPMLEVETPVPVVEKDSLLAQETSGVKSNRRLSRKSVAKPNPIVDPESAEGNIGNKSSELGDTPLAPAGSRLGRGTRGTRGSVRAADIAEVKNGDAKETESEVAETQPWISTLDDRPSISNNADEEPTQPFEKDPEVLLPGQSGVDIDTYAETQPLEQTVNEEPIVKKSKISDGDIPPVKKSSRRSQVSKPALEEAAPARIGRRKSAIQALADLQPAETQPAQVAEAGTSKTRGKSLKLAPSLLLEEEEIADAKKPAVVKNPVVNRLGRRNKKLKMPSSLLIESPAAEDMFVDDADQIPSPLTNGTPVVPLKTRATRKFRSKAAEIEQAEDLEAIEEDEPVEKRKTVRSSRNARAENTTNVQSVKPKPTRASLQPVPSRKSLDDFSPRSKTKMESKMAKAQNDIAEEVTLGKPKRGKRKVEEQVEPDKQEVIVDESCSKEATAAPKRGGRGRRTAEVPTVTKKDEKPTEEIVVEPIVVEKVKRGRAKKVDAIDQTVVEPKPVSRGRGRKADPVNSTVAVMEVEAAPEPPVVTKRGGRNRRTEPVNIDPPVELSSGRRTRNTSGDNNASAKAAPEADPVLESEVTKPGGAGRRGRGRKDSETSTVSTASNNSGKGKKKVVEVDKAASSSSSSGSRGRKRPAEETPEGSSSKKRMEDVSSIGSVRSRLSSSMDSTASPSLRKMESLTKKKHLVMFTGYNDQNDITLVKELHGSTTDSLTDCTVLVTDQIRRTAKFLSMVGRGVPIVAPLWLTESKRSGKFLDPWDFILKDAANEKKWGFKLEDTLRRASRARLLAGLYIHVTGHVKPSPEQCKDFIECGGGEFIETLPTKAVPGLHIVSCSEDKKLTSSLAKMGVPVMDKEWMLSGLLKYKLDKNLKLK